MTQFYSCRATIKHKQICKEKYILTHKIRTPDEVLHPNPITQLNSSLKTRDKNKLKWGLNYWDRVGHSKQKNPGEVFSEYREIKQEHSTLNAVACTQ